MFLNVRKFFKSDFVSEKTNTEQNHNLRRRWSCEDGALYQLILNETHEYLSISV